MKKIIVPICAVAAAATFCAYAQDMGEDVEEQQEAAVEEAPAEELEEGGLGAGEKVEAQEPKKPERNHARGKEGGGGGRRGGMGERKPGVEGREADFEAKADNGADEGGEEHFRLAVERAGEQEGRGAALTGQKVDPRRLFDAFFVRFEGDETSRRKPHGLPGEEEEQRIVGKDDAQHRGEHGQEKNPEARSLGACFVFEVGRCMRCGGETDCQ